MPKPNPLPETNNEYWEGEKYVNTPTRIEICTTHTKDTWLDTKNQYVDNHDGTISCKFCSWGSRLPGYLRFIDNKIVDLRDINRG
jgi:hypothetical protein